MNRIASEGLVLEVKEAMRKAGITVADVRLTRDLDRESEVDLTITGSVAQKALALSVSIASFGMDRDIEVYFSVVGQFENGLTPEVERLPGEGNYIGPSKLCWVDEMGNFRAQLGGGKISAEAIKKGMAWFKGFIDSDAVRKQFLGYVFIENSNLFNQASIQYKKLFEEHGYPRSVRVANSLVFARMPADLFGEEGLLAISRYAGMAAEAST